MSELFPDENHRLAGGQPTESVPESWGIGPGELLPVHPFEYPVLPSSEPPVRLPDHKPKNSFSSSLRYNAYCGEQAQAYLGSVLPGVSAALLSNEGVTSVVLTDGQYAYKVRRRLSSSYAMVEDEAAIQQLLSQAGIMPPLVALIDAQMPYRAGYRGQDMLADARILRVEPEGSYLPVIVTEKRDLQPIDALPDDLLEPEFRRFVQTALDLKIAFEDPHIFYDPQTNRAVAIDPGEYVFLDSLPGISPRHDQRIIMEHIATGFANYRPSEERRALLELGSIVIDEYSRRHPET